MGREIKPEWDNITKLAVEAENLHTSYGKLRAAMYAASQGDYIQQDKIFGEYKSRKVARIRREAEERRRLLEATAENPPEYGNEGRKCPYCGKAVGGRKTYCNEYCRYMKRRKAEGKA